MQVAPYAAPNTIKHSFDLLQEHLT